GCGDGRVGERRERINLRHDTLRQFNRVGRWMFSMSYDVIVIGGSFAGLAAALQLARARKRVLVLDSGKPRNRFAQFSHGFFGHDGQSPSAILANARSQLLCYGTVSFAEGLAA